jgi:hypothetical protein
MWPARYLGSVAVAFVFFTISLPRTSHAEDAACFINKTDPIIKGIYVDNFGGLQGISASFWISGDAVFEVCSVDNGSSRIIAMNNLRKGYNPGKFSRFEWTKSANRLWYCQIVYDAPSAAAATSAPPANASTPAQGGCGNFAWSELIHILP